MEFKDYYAILGVGKQASTDDIKKAYRKLARKYHPDISKEANASKLMSQLNEANEVLSDPEKRAAYDSLGEHRQAGDGFQPNPNWDAGFEFSNTRPHRRSTEGFSDFFSSLFGGAEKHQNGGGSRAQTQGQDHHAKIIIDLADAYEGVTQTISLHAPRLNETGHVVTGERILRVKIPKGVKDGQLIRLAKQGQPGPGGGPAGDLYLEVHFRPDSRYRVVEHDVYESVPVTPWEAVLGGVIEVPTPSGKVQVTVPANSQNGHKLRLKGRGIPATPPGDLYLELKLVLPPANSEKARQLYESMARDMAFDPRQSMER
ncbi:MAG: DnaJ domain-containing protein [Burkholderiales bacterium]|nr:DnaJ domain-containing protein [Burkholderiales bacterium]